MNHEDLVRRASTSINTYDASYQLFYNAAHVSAYSDAREQTDPAGLWNSFRRSVEGAADHATLRFYR